MQLRRDQTRSGPRIVNMTRDTASSAVPQGISPGHLLIGRAQTDIPLLRPQGVPGIEYAVAAVR